ncbi:beta-1,3-galactosyltransferase 4-like [Convolutriloba macropyga]|uniref:beta-1,3-galactosyltransferase 4-like n=1 Tax=Convolutriloba macropyga TaxID=536237 RepID=UPI003F51FE61
MMNSMSISAKVMRRKFSRDVFILIVICCFSCLYVALFHRGLPKYAKSWVYIRPLPVSEDGTMASDRCEMVKWPARKDTHRDAPLWKLPSQTISPISSKMSVCQNNYASFNILLVLSYPGNYLVRKFVRSTYGNLSDAVNRHPTLRGNWKVFFLIGRPEDDDTIQSVIVENKVHNDVLVVNLTENYETLTLKMIMAYNFITCNCPNINYLVKTDDDYYIRIPKLDSLVDELEKRTGIKRGNSTLGLYSGADCHTSKGMHLISLF